MGRGMEEAMGEREGWVGGRDAGKEGEIEDREK